MPHRRSVAIEVQLADAVRRCAELSVVCIGVDGAGWLRDAFGADGAKHLVAVLLDELRVQSPAGTVAGALDDARLVFGLPCGADDARLWARRAITRHRSLPLRAREVPLRLAAGVATATVCSSAAQLVDDASAALRDATRSGSTVTVHHDGIRARAADHLAFEVELRRAIELDSLHLAFQPVLSLVGSDVVGAEALLRWTTPWGAAVPPSTIVAGAEQVGLGADLARWVIRRAAAHVTPSRWVSVNVSPHAVTADLAEVVRRTLVGLAVPAGGLWFELAPGPLPDHAVDVIERVRDLGCRVGLSGLGSTPLADLLRLPLDFVKLDGALTARLEHDDQQRIVVHGLVQVAADLGLDVIAGGVEREAQAQALVRLGVLTQQGNLHARPRTEAPVAPVVPA